MSLFKFFIILALSCLSLSVLAETHFECQVLGSGRINYTYQILLKDNELRILQSSINAQYAPIRSEIFETRFEKFPNEPHRFRCQTRFPSGYSYKISVFQSLVTVEQFAADAKYEILAWNISL
jgi:hypothetical protein